MHSILNEIGFLNAVSSKQQIFNAVCEDSRLENFIQFMAKGVITMDEDTKLTLAELKEMMKMLNDTQEKILKNVELLVQEQKKIHEEIRLNNIVLNNISIRSEILN